MNNKFERQLLMLLIFMVLLLVFVFMFLILFAGDDVAWAVGSLWERISPFMPLICLGLGFWMGFRAASGTMGKVMNTVGMAIPGFVANSKVQVEMAKLQRAQTIEQRPMAPPAGTRIPNPPVPYQPPVNPYQDVVDGYQGTLKSRRFEYLEESDYNQGGGGF